MGKAKKLNQVRVHSTGDVAMSSPSPAKSLSDPLEILIYSLLQFEEAFSTETKTIIDEFLESSEEVMYEVTLKVIWVCQAMKDKQKY